MSEPEFDLNVTRRSVEADGVVALTFAHPEGRHLPAWAPGAHIDVMTGAYVRQYSLCGDPSDRRSWRIAVLNETHGRGGSKAVHDSVVEGGRVSVRGPRNHFELRASNSYVFVAGGIGITPIMPMIAAIEDTGLPWELIYGGRHMASMAFAEHLRGLYGDRVKLCPEDTHGLLDIDRIVAEAPDEALVYACGPNGLLTRLEEVCETKPSIRVHVERFAAKPDQRTERQERSFEVIARVSGVQVVVPEDRTIISVLEDAGVEIVTSCEEGVCGTCETNVIAGVPDHRDSVLSDGERSNNEVMMICVSRARTDSLTLDI